MSFSRLFCVISLVSPCTCSTVLNDFQHIFVFMREMLRFTRLSIINPLTFLDTYSVQMRFQCFHFEFCAQPCSSYAMTILGNVLKYGGQFRKPWLL